MSDSYPRLRTVLNLSVFAVLSLATAALVMRSRSETAEELGVGATMNGTRYPMQIGAPTAHWLEFEAGMSVEGQIEIDFPSGTGLRGRLGPGLMLLLSPNLTPGEVGFASYSADGVEVRYLPVFGHDSANGRMLVFSTEGEEGEGVLALDTFEPRPGGVISGTLRRAVLRGHFDPFDGSEANGDPEKERVLALNDLPFTVTIER